MSAPAPAPAPAPTTYLSNDPNHPPTPTSPTFAPPPPNPNPLSATNLFNANGLVAVITGGGTGLGLMIARALANNGAQKIYIVGRRQEPLDNAARIHGVNGNITPLVGDVTSKDSLTALVAKIKSEVGYINLLINNSGVLGRDFGSQFPKPEPFGPGIDPAAGVEAVQELLWADTVSDWSQTLTINVAGPYFTSVAFLSLLVAGTSTVPQGSQVVFVSSIAALHSQPVANFQYNASKAAVSHLAKMWSSNFAQWGVRANTIVPGMYPSEMTAGVGGADELGRSSLEGKRYPRAVIPVERPGREEEMAGAILGLVGVGGGYLNGTTVVTDGGRLGVLPGIH